MAEEQNITPFGGINFNVKKTENPCIIKVVGVGGGGGNAINHMYREGIHEVTYVVCNTDKKALNDSPVPNHLQLGKDGLGAGNNPAVGRQRAEESIDDIRGLQLLLYTDGLNEAENGKQEILGNDRLLELMAGMQSLSARQVIEGLCEAVAQHRAGADPNDDLTLMCLKLTK